MARLVAGTLALITLATAPGHRSRSSVVENEPRTTAAGHQTPPIVDTLDAKRVHTGRFVYRITQDEEEVADLILTIDRLEDGNYQFTGEVHGSNSQRWKSVATRSFNPIAAVLEFRQDGEITYFMDLAYGHDQVTSLIVDRRPDREPTLSQVDGRQMTARVPTGVVDQRIDWAAVLASDLAIGEPFQFGVYDPSTGVSRLVGEVAGEERVRVPAGSYDAFHAVYRIEKSSGTEPYEMWATRQVPRMMARIRMRGDAVAELIEHQAIDPR